MSEAFIEYGTSFPCIREPLPSSERCASSAIRGQPVPNSVVPRISHGSKEPKQESLPGALAWIVPSFQRSSLGPCNSPNRLFSRSFVLDPNSPPSYQRSRLHCFLRPISSSHSFNIVLLLSLHTATAVNPPPPVAVLPRF